MSKYDHTSYPDVSRGNEGGAFQPSLSIAAGLNSRDLPLDHLDQNSKMCRILTHCGNRRFGAIRNLRKMKQMALPIYVLKPLHLRSNPPVLHRKEKNIHRINRLTLRSSGITSVDVVGTGPQTGLRGTVFSKVINLGYRTRLAVKTE